MISYHNNQLTVQDYNRLRESVGWRSFAKEQAQKAIEQSTYLMTAYDNKTAVGMTRVIGDGIYYLLVDIVVDIGYQGQGIGRHLVQSVIEEIETQLLPENRASLHLVAAVGKEVFYEKLGFERMPNDVSGSGMRLLIERT